jgi:aspartyl-tRNA(Asn)/glutamyl-tRNA(Gln) amidotransferase subunit B
MEYDVIIGLEIHAELKTKSKMFCGCDNDAQDKQANSTVCPVCLGHPGTLPYPNKKAVEDTILAGLALHCSVAELSKFDRKNYFYPDLPKGYQISQFDLPLVFGGWLEVDGRKISITRIHLEEDTGKSFHPAGKAYTLVDYNRAGTPLMELVTEPVIRTPGETKKFCQNFRDMLRYLDISNADMEKGEMRCEANISIQEKGKWSYEPNHSIGQSGLIVPLGSYKLNPKIEIKNINSFRAVERAVEFEIKRQQEVLDERGKLVQETRGWDENKGQTFSQRIKETSADYRYFPEPDIPPLKIDGQWIEAIKARMIEMPTEKKKRFIEEYEMAEPDAEQIVSEKALADFAENAISELRAWIDSTGDSWERQKKRLSKLASNWLLSELFKHLNADKKCIQEIQITPENFAELLCLVYQEKINSSAGQTILEEMYKRGGDPTIIMQELGLEQMDDEVALEEIAKNVIMNNNAQVEQYKAGKTAVLQFLVGMVMAESKGKANPKKVQDLLLKLLS